MIGSAPTPSTSRRRFLADGARTACGVGLLGLALALYHRQTRSSPADALRPPGALAPDVFTGACIRCGLCVRACPYRTLRLARIEDDVPAGTPYFVAREVPCEMCEDLPCVRACPTGALDPGLESVDAARMGVAVLVDHEHCLNYQGLRCDVCYRVCPVIDVAITLDVQRNPRTGRHALFIPTVHADACTGCGKCEYACVLPEAAIKVLPQRLARSGIAGHYRFGLDERDKAGRSLIGGEETHDYNLPEGLRYEHGGRGLIGDEAPFPDEPLESLNRPRQEARP